MSFLRNFTIRHLCLIACLLLTVPLIGAKGKYPIINFTPEDYKAGIQNIDFAQNRDMSLYVANNLGVLSFNGHEWETHAFFTGKKQRSLAFDETSNRLYVGSQGEFGYFENNWNYTSLLEKIPLEAPDFDEVWDVFIFDSLIYFCTFQGIYIYDGNTINVIQQEDDFNRSFLAGSKLFTQSQTGQLFEIKDKVLSPLAQINQANDILAGVIQNAEGYIFFYNSGIIEFSNLFGVTEALPELANTLEGNFVNQVIQLSDSRIVISTQRAGLFLYNEQTNTIENISTKEGLLSNACLRAFQDYSGNLWVGMQNGLALIDINSPLRLINQDINLQGSGYEAFDTDDGTYYTTSNGIYFLPINATSCLFLEGTEGPSYGMQMINNKLYAGHHTGLFLLEKGVAQRRANTDGLWQIKQLRSNPKYAIAGTYSGLYLFELNSNGLLDEVQKINGFEESSRFFEEDRQGRIWVGQYYKGLYKLDLSESFKSTQVSNISENYDLPIKTYIILRRINDELYLGTKEGIFKIDQNTDVIAKDEVFSEVIGSDWVYLLEQDNQKNVHVYTENQLGFFKQVSTNNFTYIPSSLFQLRQSFNNDLLRVSTKVSEGILYNANEGFIEYRPKMEDRISLEMKPLVTRVFNIPEDSIVYARMPFSSRTDIVGSSQITEGTKVLQFIVESYKFNNVNNQQFRYYLDGFDKDYGDWTNTAIKEYTNLKAGNYKFYVQTLNSLGEVVTGAPVSIEVHPPFFKSVIARIIYGILLIVLITVLYRLQRRYYHRKQTKMEMAKREELALKHEELQELKKEQIESELRHVNNLLAASTMNLVAKNEFIENIKEEVKQVKTLEKTEDRQKVLERIVKTIDSTSRVHEDWKQFEHHFDQVHGDFLSRLTTQFLDLTPGEQKLSAFLRLNMDTKQISNLMGISLRGVEVARYRLRKKLGLTSHQNLSKFILEY